MKRFWSRCVVLFVVSFSFAANPPATFMGKVTALTDGDTLTVLVGKEQHKIRLNGIDCP